MKKGNKKMSWIDKMKSAMLDIQAACMENGEWNNCCKCPFNHYCNIICEHDGLDSTPYNWNHGITPKEIETILV